MPNHPPGRNHRKLIAWQEAIKLVVLVYREARSFPREELFGLTAQVKKSVNSIAFEHRGGGREELKSRTGPIPRIRQRIQGRNRFASRGRRTAWIPAGRLGSIPTVGTRR